MITADTVSDFLELAEKNGWQIADEKVGRLLSRVFSAAQRMEAAAAEAESFGEQFDRDMMIELQAEIGRQEIFGMLAEIVGMRIAVNNAETEETLQEEELLLPDDIMDPLDFDVEEYDESTEYAEEEDLWPEAEESPAEDSRDTPEEEEEMSAVDAYAPEDAELEEPLSGPVKSSFQDSILDPLRDDEETLSENGDDDTEERESGYGAEDDDTEEREAGYEAEDDDPEKSDDWDSDDDKEEDVYDLQKETSAQIRELLEEPSYLASELVRFMQNVELLPQEVKYGVYDFLDAFIRPDEDDAYSIERVQQLKTVITTMGMLRVRAATELAQEMQDAETDTDDIEDTRKNLTAVIQISERIMRDMVELGHEIAGTTPTLFLQGCNQYAYDDYVGQHRNADTPKLIRAGLEEIRVETDGLPFELSQQFLLMTAGNTFGAQPKEEVSDGYAQDAYDPDVPADEALQAGKARHSRLMEGLQTYRSTMQDVLEVAERIRSDLISLQQSSNLKKSDVADQMMQQLTRVCGLGDEYSPAKIQEMLEALEQSAYALMVVKTGGFFGIRPAAVQKRTELAKEAWALADQAQAELELSMLDSDDPRSGIDPQKPLSEQYEKNLATADRNEKRSAHGRERLQRLVRFEDLQAEIRDPGSKKKKEKK